MVGPPCSFRPGSYAVAAWLSSLVRLRGLAPQSLLAPLIFTSSVQMCDGATQVSGAVMQTGGVAIWTVGYVSTIIGAIG